MNQYDCRLALNELGRHGEEFREVQNSTSRPLGCYFCGQGTFILASCDNGAYFNNHVIGGSEGLHGNSAGTGEPVVYSGLQRICVIIGHTIAMGQVLFVGNTDIDYWDTCTDYPGTYNVGGNYTCENVASEISALVIKFGPSAVVLACGEKDMANGATALSAATRFGNVVDVLKANNIPTFYKLVCSQRISRMML
jgi:hypothetical protein